MKHSAPFSELSLLLLGLLSLSLPACFLDSSGIVAPVHIYTASAQVRSGDGRVVPVGSDDMLFAAGAPPVLATYDVEGSSLPEEFMLGQWTRYLRRRLEAPGATDEFRARFGAPPFCLVSAAVRRTDAIGTLSAEELGDPLMACSAIMPDTCSNAPGVVPRLEAAPSGLDFGGVPVGTLRPDVLVTLANAGAGRLCLDSPALDPTLSPQLEDFSLDGSDCLPRSAAELDIDRTILDVSRPTCSLRLSFRPGDPGLRRAVLRLASSDPMQPVQNLPLSGSGQPGVLRPFPNPLCLNTPEVVVAGHTDCHRNTLHLVNDGPGEVQLLRPTLSIPGANWTLGFLPAAPPVMLAVGAELQVVARVCDAAPPETTLMVSSNASVPLFEVPFLLPSSGCLP